jgi:hypothetical protein
VRMLFALAAGSMLVVASLSAQAAKSLTDAQVKAAIVKASIASYAGSCPCPFNTDGAGRRCGARSAYSRPGGKSPLCYIDDVTAKMVQAYRSAREQKAEAVPAEKEKQ